MDFMLTLFHGIALLERIARHYESINSIADGIVLMDRAIRVFPSLVQKRSVDTKMNKYLDIIDRLRGFKQSIVEEAKTPFTLENNREKLVELWTVYSSDDKQIPPVPSEEWKRLGFQGTDPSSDFRGMGLLGLNQFLYICSCQIIQLL